MKIILLKDVPGVGQKGGVKDVSAGYAMNMLIPRGLAKNADDAALKDAARAQREADAKRAKDIERWEKEAKKLSGGFVTVRAPANKEDHLYSQITMAAIAERIKSEHQIEIPISSIETGEAIRTLGRHNVNVRLGEKKVVLTVAVERE